MLSLFDNPMLINIALLILALLTAITIHEAAHAFMVIYLDVGLAVFNLIPIHPLDGGKILIGLLPTNEARLVDAFLNQYGLFVLILLLIPIFGGAPIISIVVSPIIKFLLSIFIPGT